MQQLKQFWNSIRHRLSRGRINRWVKAAWHHALNADISVTKGYLTLFVLLLLGIGLWIGNQYWQELQLLAAIEAAPEDGESYRDLNLFHINNTRRRLVLFEQLREDFPDSPWPPLFLAYITYAETIEKNQAAEESISIAEEAVPLVEEENTFNSLVGTFYRAGAFDAAEAVAETWSQRHPDSAEAYYSLGQSQKESGHFQEAETSFKICNELIASGDDFPSYVCARDLITGTRHITLTLQSDHLLVQTRAALNVSNADVHEVLPQWDLPYAGRNLSWGLTAFGPRRFYLRRYGDATTVSLDEDEMVVVEDGFRMYYHWLWQGQMGENDTPVIRIERLPLGAYAGGTTITIVGTEDVGIVEATHPYTRVEGQMISWVVTDQEEWKRPLQFSVSFAPFNELLLRLRSNPWLNATAGDWLLASPTLMLLAILFTMRKKESVANLDARTGFVYRLLHPKSIFSWIFDAVVVGLSGLTIFYQIWLTVTNYPFQPQYPPAPYYAYVFTMVLVLLRLMVHALHDAYQDDDGTMHLGAVLFACYLMPRLHTSYLFYIQFFISLLVYYGMVINGRKWLSTFSWQQTKAIIANNHSKVIKKILQIDELATIKKTSRNQDLALAKGDIKPSEYIEAQSILDIIISRGEAEAHAFKSQLGIPEKQASKDILFRLGPGKNPLTNGLLALTAGSIPYLLFIVLASFSGELWQAYRGGSGLISIGNFLFDILAVPWGPIYLVTFGFLYHMIRGKYGATKGLMFGIALTVLNAVYSWMLAWNQVDAIELWGITFRVLSTFMFVGVILDWMTIGFSWRRIKQFYDSPAFASVLTIAGGAVATIVTGFLTGTLNQLLGLALHGASSALGIDISVAGP